MLLFILKNAIISIILIFLLHYIYDYFKTNLTTPKVKDLVNKPQKQYETLFDTMKETSIKPKPTSAEDNSNMKNELKNYLKELSDSKKSSNSSSTSDVNTLPTSGQSTMNVNHNGGLLTNENLMGGSLNSSSYSSF